MQDMLKTCRCVNEASRTLLSVCGGVTAVVVACHLSTVEHCDKVSRLNGGSLTEVRSIPVETQKV